MIAAIGTVLFWGVACVGAYLTFIFGLLILSGIGMLLWQILRAVVIVVLSPFMLIFWLIGAAIDGIGSLLRRGPKPAP
jgi:hypothetical protein